ncbi:MAG TPA: FadR/GntR family transcriptional regulator [Bacilli bacterium]|nr:FadR/GntR family transcriptional regulator [Bacilli bacterium]
MAAKKQKKIYEQIADKIKGMIEQGHLQPGDKLPDMRTLAAEFGVSRLTVREAFSSLAGMGLLQLRHGEGTFVQKIDVETMVTKPMNAALLLGMGDLFALLETRRALEVGTVELLCDRKGTINLAPVETALANMRDGGAHPEEWVSADLQFHLALAEASGNSVLHNLMSTMSEALRSMIRERLAEAEQRQEALRQHERIVEALRARDKVRAIHAVRAHLEDTEAWLRERRTLGK